MIASLIIILISIILFSISVLFRKLDERSYIDFRYVTSSIKVFSLILFVIGSVSMIISISIGRL